MRASGTFQKGQKFRYADLMAALPGGSHQFYLPYKGQQVFAALLTKGKNPGAPNTILVGSKKRVVYAAALLLNQSAPVPVFLKERVDSWAYLGLFRSNGVLSQSMTATLARTAHRSDVTVALQMTADDSSQDQQILEGACNQVTRNAYERDAAARSICLAYYGPRCVVCEIEFGEEYGEIGSGFIHVHHLELLSANGERWTDPTKDLVPVCPNCHAMLHSGGMLKSPREIRALYWSNESVTSRAARRSRTAWKKS